MIAIYVVALVLSTLLALDDLIVGLGLITLLVTGRALSAPLAPQGGHQPRPGPTPDLTKIRSPRPARRRRE